MEVILHSIENVLLHISRNFTYPNWGQSHQVRISEVLLYYTYVRPLNTLIIRLIGELTSF